MTIESNTFAEACYDMNTLKELKAALTQDADESDMKEWNLTEQEWREQIELAIAEKEVFKVTNIQFFDQSREVQVGEFDDETIKAYGANVTINNEFVIQVSGNDSEAEKAAFAPSDCCFVSTEEEQEEASAKYDIDDVIEQIENNGFENNFDYLAENGESM